MNSLEFVKVLRDSKCETTEHVSPGVSWVKP